MMQNSINFSFFLKDAPSLNRKLFFSYKLKKAFLDEFKQYFKGNNLASLQVRLGNTDVALREVPASLVGVYLDTHFQDDASYTLNVSKVIPFSRGILSSNNIFKDADSLLLVQKNVLENLRAPPNNLSFPDYELIAAFHI